MATPKPRIATAMVAFFNNSDEARAKLKTTYPYRGIWYRGTSKLHLFSGETLAFIQKRGYTRKARQPAKDGGNNVSAG